MMIRFSSVRARLVGTVFLAVAPAWVAASFIIKITGTVSDWPWTLLSGVVGLLALAAAWYGGERFVLRQLRALYRAARLLAAGDLSSRTGLGGERGEIGDLARSFDAMAVSLEQRVREREQVEKTLISRSLQQTVVSALGQFALVSTDFQALLNQAVMMVAQTLEVEYCALLRLQTGSELLLEAGLGWRPGLVGKYRMSGERDTQPGFTLVAGEPVIVEDLAQEKRFQGSPLLTEHGVVSGVTVAVVGQGPALGVLGAHTSRRRKFNEDEVHFLMAVATVLAMALARKQAEAEIEKLASFAQLNPNPAMELTINGLVSYCNAAAMRLASAMGQEHPGRILPPNISAIIHTCLSSGPATLNLETRQDGHTLAWSFHPVAANQVVHAYVEDITNRRSLEAQLRQSQKMESVGQLAAGVAHDFNNMLTIIQGHSGLLLTKSADKPEFMESAQAIYFASERAAALTRQLLMFSRKNVMQPKLLDLRETVSQLSKMLQRLLGETITLEFHPPADLPLVEADAGMIEQVIMNLSVNARDAMPKGGRLTVTINPVDIPAEYVQLHPEAHPGAFVCLRVTDTGCGMDQATQARIFEPFFTTKEVGKGTGLGLATVYGIVRQHEGWIQVASEPGQGSTFSIFLPASKKLTEPKKIAVQTPSTPVQGGRETILLVEDEPVLRDLAHVILQESGYQILEAASGREALDMWHQHHQRIDLVLTDMVMPEGVSGMELAQQLIRVKPNVKIIFASGYSMDDLDTAFLRRGQAGFLQKPYTHVTLAKAVRDCLDGKVN